MGFWADVKRQAQNINLNYLGGHPDIPKVRKVGVRAEDGNICICNGVQPLASIPKSEVIGVTMDRASKRSGGKAAAGAIIGGVLTGGLGLLAGAAIGGRKKDDSIIVLKYKYNGVELEAFFNGDNVPGLYGQFVKMLK